MRIIFFVFDDFEAVDIWEGENLQVPNIGHSVTLEGMETLSVIDVVWSSSSVVEITLGEN